MENIYADTRTAEDRRQILEDAATQAVQAILACTDEPVSKLDTLALQAYLTNLIATKVMCWHYKQDHK